jgi:hypothetical protein
LALIGNIPIAEQRLPDVQYSDDQARAIAAIAMARAGSDRIYAATRMAERSASVKYRMQAFTYILLTYAAHTMPEHVKAIDTLRRRLDGGSES